MKISKHNYPILDKLHKGKLVVIPVAVIDLDLFPELKQLDALFSHFAPQFKSSINVVSKTFSDALNINKTKLINLYVDIVNNAIEDIKVSGTYIFGKDVYMLDFEYDKSTNNFKTVIMVFHSNALLYTYFIDYPILGSGFWISKTAEQDPNFYHYKDNLVSYPIDMVKLMVITEMFKKYGNTEIKTIEPNRKIKGNIYIKNESEFKVNYLDSTWFTTTISNNPFAVKGHFRLQPKKINGEWTREIIWIKDFKKQGYTSVAKKIISNA